MNAEQFARVKALYDHVCDLPAAQRASALQAATGDAEVIAEVLRLCDADGSATARMAGPVLQALRRPPDASSLRSGDVLGAWTLLEEIGEGGMGRVFKARRSDGHFEQTAAIKLLAGVASREALAHLARERQILASLVHPNIARLLDGGSTPSGQPYLVMEYIEGLPFDRYCREHALPRSTLLSLFIDVCAAVAFAHRSLVIHCDLKPANILVTRDGRPILLDFGVAHLLGDAQVASDVRVHDGAPLAAVLTNAAFTPRYASPEQKRLERVGTASDIYSLGMMLAELLGADLREDKPSRHAPGAASGAAGTVTFDLSHLPRGLAAIILRATHPAAPLRYVSVDALAADLNRFMAHQPVSALPPRPTYVGALWLRRHWPWAVAASLFLATIAGFSWRMREERDAARRAERAAVAVKDYMVSVFQGADPEVSGQRDLPVSTLLDAGRDQLQDDLQHQPEVQVEIGGILGSVYQNIGQREQALKMFEDAIAIEQRQPRPAKLAELRYKQAYTLYDMEDFPRALPIAEEAVARHEALGGESIALAESLRLLGSILNYNGDAERAGPILQRALQMATRTAGPDSLEVARTQLDIARLHIFNEPNPIDAVPLAANAVRIIGVAKGESHYLYPEALEIHALALGNTGQLDAALPLIRASTDRRIALYGEISNQAGYSLYTLGSLLQKRGQRIEAIAVFERCIRIQKALDGGDTLAGEVPIYLMAQTLEKAGRLDDALAAFERSRAIRSRLLPEGERNLLDHDAAVGRIRRLQGDVDTALAIAESVRRRRIADPGTHPVRRFQADLDWTAALRAAGRLDEALAVLDAIDPEASGMNAERRAWADLERARILAARGAHDPALAAMQDAETRLAAELGADHPDAWLAKLDRAEGLARVGQREDAQTLAREIAAHAAPGIAADGDWARRLDALIRG